MVDQALIADLGKAIIFKDLPGESLVIAAGFGHLEMFTEDQLIIREGQENPGLHLVLRGEVEVFLPREKTDSSDPRATQIRLGSLAGGECFGDFSLIDGNPASASVSARTPCALFKIPSENFHRMADSNHTIAMVIYRNMLEILVQRARVHTRELDMLIF